MADTFQCGVRNTLRILWRFELEFVLHNPLSFLTGGLASGRTLIRGFYSTIDRLLSHRFDSQRTVDKGMHHISQKTDKLLVSRVCRELLTG